MLYVRLIKKFFDRRLYCKGICIKKWGFGFLIVIVYLLYLNK